MSAAGVGAVSGAPTPRSTTAAPCMECTRRGGYGGYWRDPYWGRYGYGYGPGVVDAPETVSQTRAIEGRGFTRVQPRSAVARAGSGDGGGTGGGATPRTARPRGGSGGGVSSGGGRTGGTRVTSGGFTRGGGGGGGGGGATSRGGRQQQQRRQQRGRQGRPAPVRPEPGVQGLLHRWRPWTISFLERHLEHLRPELAGDVEGLGAGVERDAVEHVDPARSPPGSTVPPHRCSASPAPCPGRCVPGSPSGRRWRRRYRRRTPAR